MNDCSYFQILQFGSSVLIKEQHETSQPPCKFVWMLSLKSALEKQLVFDRTNNPRGFINGSAINGENRSRNQPDIFFPPTGWGCLLAHICHLTILHYHYPGCLLLRLHIKWLMLRSPAARTIIVISIAFIELGILTCEPHSIFIMSLCVRTTYCWCVR